MRTVFTNLNRKQLKLLLTSTGVLITIICLYVSFGNSKSDSTDLSSNKLAKQQYKLPSNFFTNPNKSTENPVIEEEEPTNTIVEPQPQKSVSNNSLAIMVINDSSQITDLSETINYTEQDEEQLKGSVPSSTASYPNDLSRTLTAFKFISATLYTRINSEIASEKVIAIVDHDIYGDMGRKLLIPKGTKVLGRYKPLNNAESERIAIDWYRMLTPEGINIVLPSQKMYAETADINGASGMGGDIDHRFDDKYGAALIFSTINAAAQLSVGVKDERQKAIIDSYSYPLGALTVENIRSSINIKPTLTIEKGTNIIISPRYDLWFAKPRQNNIDVQILDELVNSAY